MRNIFAKSERNRSNGFTLIELIAVIVIAGILGAVAIQKVGTLGDRLKVEETMIEMDHLSFAIVGNPDLINNGIRSDFGYVGDIGSLPPNLDALVINPGGFATWRGPYVTNSIEQITGDYKKDAWQTNYSFAGGVNLTSTGSGDNITRRLAGSSSEILLNSISGITLDLDGTPPGTVYKDSFSVSLIIPNGSGGTMTITTALDIGGFFSFDSVPIGSHSLEVVYLPNSDTITRYVSITPNSKLYAEYFLSANVWTASGGGPTGGIEYVAGSAQTQTGNCDRIEFDITNTTASSITISSITTSWSSPVAFYRKVKWANSTVFNTSNPSAASGQTVTFSSSQSIGAGSTVTLQFDKFNSVVTGNGSKVDMSNTDMTITFSDGSVINFNTGVCN